MSPPLSAMVGQSLVSPRTGMRAVLALGLPRGTGLAAVALAAVLSALAMGLSDVLLPGGRQPLPFGMPDSPVTLALVQFGFFVLMAEMICWTGRARGGQGDQLGALLAVAWLQVVMLAVQVALLLATALVPDLAGVLLPLTLVLYFWLLTGFVAEVHGFASLPRVFAGILLTLMSVALILSFILAALIGPEVLRDV